MVMALLYAQDIARWGRLLRLFILKSLLAPSFATGSDARDLEGGFGNRCSACRPSNKSTRTRLKLG